MKKKQKDETMKEKKEGDEGFDVEDIYSEIAREAPTTNVFSEAAKETLAMGIPVYYSPWELPEDQMIKEYPNGKKQLLRTWWVNGEYHKEVIKDLN